MRTIVDYNELVDYALQYIYQLCDNVDSIKPSVPGDMKNGYSRVLAQSDKQTITMKVSDNVVKAVKSNTIKNEFINYLSQNGLYSKSGTKVNAKGVLNFFNYVSAFISGHVFLIMNNISGNKCMIYITDSSGGSAAIPAISKVDETEYTDGRPNDVLFTDTMNETNLTSLSNAIKHTSGVRSLNVLINYACSSSSSSSSSSCSCSSSSSCCSSSSSYIVYMMI